MCVLVMERTNMQLIVHDLPMMEDFRRAAAIVTQYELVLNVLVRFS